MPFWGVGGDFTGVTPTRSTRSDVSHGGNTTFQTAHSNSLNPGVYLVSVSYTPSDDSGNYPNGDPDGWYMRINKSGSVICDEQYFEEGGSTSTNQNSGSLTATFQSNGTDDIYFQVRTTDGDGGGVGGRYACHCFAIMRQS